MRTLGVCWMSTGGRTNGLIWRTHTEFQNYFVPVTNKCYSQPARRKVDSDFPYFMLKPCITNSSITINNINIARRGQHFFLPLLACLYAVRCLLVVLNYNKQYRAVREHIFDIHTRYTLCSGTQLLVKYTAVTLLFLYVVRLYNHNT